MVCGKFALKLVDRFSFLALMASAYPYYSSMSWERFLSKKFNDLFLLIVGELVCPAYHELCSKDSVSVPGKCPNTCNFNGDCVDGKCFCFLGFHGHDCSKREHQFLSCITSFYVDKLLSQLQM